GSGTGTKKTGSTPSTGTSQPKVATKAERDELDFSQKPKKSISSLFELIGTSVNIPNKDGGSTHYDCPLNDQDNVKGLLPALLDKATTRSDPEIPARVNINTAPLAVLAATLFGLKDEEIQSILEHRPNALANQPLDTVYQTPAWLITEAGLAPAKV